MGVVAKYFRGKWWVFINHRGRRKAKKCDDRKTALEVARKVRERLLLGDLSLLGGTGDRLEKYARAWLKEGEANRKASTHRFYSFNIDLHIVPSIGTVTVGSITRAECRKLLGDCRKKALKATSIQGVQRTLSALLSQAVEDGLLPANPAFRMGRHVRKGDEPRREIHPLTREDVETFLTTVEKSYTEYYAFFLCALRTGMRLGELLALQWSDVDFKNRFIEVRRSLVSGKLTTPKNSKVRRVDMSAKLTEVFEKRFVAVKAEKLKAGKAELSPWVFTNRDGEPLDGDNLRRRIFGPALSKAKLHEIRLHDLRHTYASLLIQQGESLAYVRDQLGHSSIQVTVDVYGHLVPGSNRAAVDRLDADPIRNPGATGTTMATEEGGRN